MSVLLHIWVKHPGTLFKDVPRGPAKEPKKKEIGDFGAKVLLLNHLIKSVFFLALALYLSQAL